MRMVEAEVGISLLPGTDQYSFAFGTSGPPGLSDTGLRTVSRSDQPDFGGDTVQARATAPFRLVVVPGSGDSVAAWSEGAASIVSGGGCD